jgi:hypothetical protein
MIFAKFMVADVKNITLLNFSKDYFVNIKIAMKWFAGIGCIILMIMKLGLLKLS